jgi:RNA-binding protein
MPTAALQRGTPCPAVLWLGMPSYLTLTGKQRQYLRSLAHDLKPVLHVGHAGLGDGLLSELDRALQTHELLKVKRHKECPLSSGEVAESLAEGTRSVVAQVIGGTVVLYRPRKKDPTIVLPKAGEEG